MMKFIFILLLQLSSYVTGKPKLPSNPTNSYNAFLINESHTQSWLMYDVSQSKVKSTFNSRKKRDVVVTTTEFSARKEIQVLRDLSNPDLFLISVNGNTNSTIYDVTLTEVTSGLDVFNYVTPDQSLLNIQPNSVQYPVGNISSSSTLEFSYSATLSNFGAEVSSPYFITTNISYFLSDILAVQRTVSLNLCIQKEYYTIYTACAWCWSILIIFVCMLTGWLLGFLIIVLYAFCRRPASGVSPYQRNAVSNSYKTASKQLRNDDKINMFDVIVMSQEKEVSCSLEILELEQLLKLEEEINDTRSLLSKYLALKMLKEKQTHAESDDHGGSFSDSLDNYLHELSHSTEPVETNELNYRYESEDVGHELKREEELASWKKALLNYPEEFQENMLALVEKRHKHDVINESFLRRLTQIFRSRKKDASSDIESHGLDSKLRRIENNKNWQNFLTIEDKLLEELMNIYSEFVNKIQQNTDIRREILSKMFDNLKKEQQIWDKLTSQQLDILKIAERQDLISQVTQQQVASKLSKKFQLIKEKFNKERKQAYRQVAQDYVTSRDKAQHLSNGEDNVIDDDDVIHYVKREIAKMKLNLENEMQTTVELDALVFRYDDVLSSLTSQTLKAIKREKEFLAESLLKAGVQDSWLETMFEKKNGEMMDFYEEIDAESVMSLTPTVRFVPSRFDEVSSELLERVRGCQKALSHSDDHKLIKQRNMLRKNLLAGATFRHIEKRRTDFQNEIMRKSMEVDDVVSGSDVEGIRRELQEKLNIAAEVKKKKKKKVDLRDKRHRSITSRNSLRELLSNQLNCYYQKLNDELALSRERCAFEELTMTLLQVMTSSGNLTSRECRLILEEFRSEIDEIKRKFALEKKRKQEVLRRETEQSLLKSKYDANNQPAGDHTNFIRSIVKMSSDVMVTSLNRMKGERTAVQELFEIRREVETEMETVLIEQGLLLIRKLSYAIGIDSEEMKKVIQLLLPSKPDDDVTKLSLAICSNERKKAKNPCNGKLLERVQQFVFRQIQSSKYENLKNLTPQSRSMLPANLHRRKLDAIREGAYPGVRPEPLGRTATPENLERF